MGSKLRGETLGRLTDRWAQTCTYKQLDCTSLTSFGKKEQGFYWSWPIDWITYSKLLHIAFWRCCFNINSMAKHFLKFYAITLVSPWAECPCWTWEAMIPSLAKVVQLQTCWKTKVWRRRRAFQKHVLNFKGQDRGFEKPNNFSEAWFLFVLQGYLLF